MRFNWFAVHYSLTFITTEKHPMLEAYFSSIYNTLHKPKGIALFKNNSDEFFVCASDNLETSILNELLISLDIINKVSCPQPFLESLSFVHGDKSVLDS